MKKYRTPKLEEFVDGFVYEAKIGPGQWDDVIFPLTGFDNSPGQLDMAIERGMVRKLIENKK